MRETAKPLRSFRLTTWQIVRGELYFTGFNSDVRQPEAQLRFPEWWEFNDRSLGWGSICCIEQLRTLLN